MAWTATLAAGVLVGIGVTVARAERARSRRTGDPLPGDSGPVDSVPDEPTVGRLAAGGPAVTVPVRGDPIPAGERRFGLFTKEPAAEGLRRIALAQLDLAMELLRGEATAPAAETIHETRKALKRLRALLALLENELGAGRTQREREVLRDCARRLAGARDAEVMVLAYGELLAREPRKLGRRLGAIELGEHLERERNAASEQALGNVAVRVQVASELGAMRERAQGWELRDRSAQKLTGSGLRGIYRSGRAAHNRAQARPKDPLALHRWRKHVKELRYALEVLDVQNCPDGPAVGAGGRNAPAGRRVARLAYRADTLGELLGEEHDLMLLGKLVREHKPLKRHRRTRRRLLRAIARRRARLGKRALRQGGTLYGRGPKRFVRWVRV
jgi:CHAD domain-containing protein